MAEVRKLAAILAADIVGYSRLAGADEDRTLARIRALRSDLIDPTIAVHNGRVVKRTGDGAIVEFRSAVDAVRCAVEIQNAMVERNTGVFEDRRIVFRIGIHIGDVVEENDGDLMGDGVNIAARLEGIATPGAICLSEDAYRYVKGRLDLKVTDLGPTRLKNIAEPVRAYSLQVGIFADAKSIVPVRSAKTPFLSKAVFPAVTIVILIAVGLWWLLDTSRSPSVSTKAPIEAARLSIVVLPFANLSGDARQDYFADGITENLTTDLSHIRNSFVIARNTALTYKGKAIDAKVVGKELDVRYLLEGSVQRDQGQVRVNAQLIDAETGAHLWADRFEEDVADLFKLQDQIVARLANSLGYELVKAEAEKSVHSRDPDAIDLDIRGRALLLQGMQQSTKENNSVARAWFEKALAIYPDDADALTGNSFTYMVEYVFRWSTNRPDYDEKVLGEADRAIALAPDNARAYWVKSAYLYLTNRASESLHAANTGLALNPNFAPLYGARSGAEISLGRFVEANADVRQAMRLSPRDPDVGWWRVQLGEGELGLGHLDAAIDEYQRAIDFGYRLYPSYIGLAAAYALSDKMSESKSALAEARRLNAALSIKWLRTRWNWAFASLPSLFEGLRKAGMPEE